MQTTYQCIDDLAKMTELDSQASALLGSKSQIHNGNIAWRLRALDLTGPVPSIALWNENESRIKSFAIVHQNRPADIQVHPNFAADKRLINEMIAWTEKVCKGSEVKISCLSSSTQMKSILLERGFCQNPLSDSYVRMEYAISQPPRETELPIGFSLLKLDSNSCPNRLLEVHNEIFPRSILTHQEYFRTKPRQPNLLDFRYALIDAASNVAAFAFSWLDTRSACLEFEPIGCRNQWRRQGLARYLLLASIERAANYGVIRATLTTRSSSRDAISFYRAMNFWQTDIEYIFSKLIV